MNSKTKSASEVARLVEKAGLTKSHKEVLLLVCHAGGEVEFSKTEKVGKLGARRSIATVLPKDHTKNKCFASVFAHELGRLGYDSIQVGAYPGSVEYKLVDGGLKITSSALKKGDSRSVVKVDGQALVQWYGAGGKSNRVDVLSRKTLAR